MKVLIIALLIGLLGFGGGILFNQNFGKNNRVLTDDTLNPQSPDIKMGQGPMEVSPSAELIKKINTLITIEPKNKGNFQKSIAEDYGCNNSPGIVSYRDSGSKYPHTMVLNNKNLPQSKDAIQALSTLEPFINGGYQVDSFDQLIEPLFKNYCGGAYDLYLKDLSSITYPGMDKSRVVMTETGQGTFGNVNVHVYGRKGDTFVYLDSFMDDESLYSAYRAACDPGDSNNYDFQAVQKCYKEKLIKDKNLEKLAIEEAKKLVKLFEI